MFEFSLLLITRQSPHIGLEYLGPLVIDYTSQYVSNKVLLMRINSLTNVSFAAERHDQTSKKPDGLSAMLKRSYHRKPTKQKGSKAVAHGDDVRKHTVANLFNSS